MPADTVLAPHPDGAAMECRTCGAIEVVPCPIDVRAMVRRIDRFDARHINCGGDDV